MVVREIDFYTLLNKSYPRQERGYDQAEALVRGRVMFTAERRKNKKMKFTDPYPRMAFRSSSGVEMGLIL